MAARVTDVAILLMLVTGCCCVGRNHRGPAVINNKQPRVPSGNRLGQSRFTCANLLAMFRRSRQLGSVINKSIGDILNTKVRNFESNLKLKVLELYRREVNASEGAVITAMAGFNRTLSSDYTSLTKIMDSCESRLQEMQSAALLVEQNHNSLHKLEKETAALLESRNQSRTEHHSLLNEFLLEISRAADVLEGTLTDNAFSNLVEEKGVDIETVVKVGGGKTHHKKPPESADSLEDEESSSNEVVIIDSSNNRYTLSRPHDITVLVEDPHLIHDIVTLLLVSCVLGLLCSLMGMPLLFGYGVAGMLLGPGGFNIIKSVVQVETLGEFGAVFIVFMAGIEFSPEKLKKVWRFSLYGSLFLLVSCTVISATIGIPFGMPLKECFFVAASLSLSSAPLAHQFLEANSDHKRISSDIECSLQNLAEEKIVEAKPSSTVQGKTASLMAYLQGLLVVQDVQMASLMAFMPFFSGTSTSFFSSLVHLMQILVGFLLLLFLSCLLCWVMEPVFKLFSLVKGKGLLLGSLAICFLMLAVALFIGASLELGCFLAGVLITAQGSAAVEQVKKLMEPVREIFAAFFFASIGFHVFASFLISEFFTILSVTSCVILFKLSVNMMLVGSHVGYCHAVCWTSALAIAQVSEFAFVLASRARRLRIVVREVYLVLVSVAAVSLILSPLLWRVPHLLGSHPSLFIARIISSIRRGARQIRWIL